MRANLANFKNIRQLESILLICALIATSIVIIVPLNAPKARAVTHLQSTNAEDGNPTYDMDGISNDVVVWSDSEDHLIVAGMTTTYVVSPGDTLIIPPLNYRGAPEDNIIEFQLPANRIEVSDGGKLITNTDEDPTTKTLFTSTGGAWDGIYFHPNSEGRILDTLLIGANNGVVFEPRSILMYPGISESRFDLMGSYGIRLDRAMNYTAMNQTQFNDTLMPTSTNLEISNMDFSISQCDFLAHGFGDHSIHISDSNVNLFEATFNGYGNQGNEVYVEGDSSGTVLNDCDFINGYPQDHYIGVNGTSILINNCTFNTSLGAFTVIAEENATGVSAHPILRNPNPPGSTFDNATLNATGGSSVTLQWYVDVYVEDSNFNAIPYIPVTVDGSAPSMPIVIQTDGEGFARGFVVTELIQYNNSRSNFNPFNVSAINNSIIGYAVPEPTINMSKLIFVIVPISGVPNLPPIVSWLPTPLGIQGQEVTIEFRLADPNGDNGYLSVVVEYSLDNLSWASATPAPGSDPTTGLLNNTLYNFTWDAWQDEPDTYNTTVYIRITPSDQYLQGPSRQTGNFTLDTLPPELFLPPSWAVTDTTATITWSAGKACDATVWYGLDNDLTDEAYNNSGTLVQSVELTSLLPGRWYSIVVNSTDQGGNTASSYPEIYQFSTEVHIQLYKGWNMISIPPIIPDSKITSVFAPIAGQYDAVQWYDALDDNDHWKHYQIGKPYGNDLKAIDLGMGLWIHMTTDIVFIPNHTPPDPTAPSERIGLIQGWNFVGYPSATTLLVNDALSGVTFDLVQTYDAATGQWLSWDGSSGDLAVMEMGRGYWIHVPSSANWFVDYA